MSASARTLALTVAIGFMTPMRASAAEPADAGGDEPEALADRLEDLEQRVVQTQELVRRRQPVLSVGGFIDVGFFAAQGTGAGYVQDVGPRSDRWFPAYADRYGWVFVGDLLAPAVNSRGEPADLGDAPGVDRFDGIGSRGAPTFIANEVNINLAAALGDTLLATASVSLLPRSGWEFRLGDGFDVDLAQIEWMPTASRRTSLFAGKIDSVLGIEYRDRKSPRRFGITPSLIARYTTGTAVGLKVRSKLLTEERLILAAALTNGSFSREAFHFHDEIDSNAGKTVSGRVAVRPPLPGSIDAEIGASGAWGAQDRAIDSRHPLWFVGADLRVRRGAVALQAEWLMGRGRGETDALYEPDHRPYGLDLRSGAYVELDWMLTATFGVLGRAEARDALVWLGNPSAPSGAERLYVTKSWRAVLGVRAVLNAYALLKAEYLRNGEFGGVPAIANDVFTSSVVVAY